MMRSFLDRRVILLGYYFSRFFREVGKELGAFQRNDVYGQASTCLMQYYAVQDPGLPQKFSVPVFLTRKGLPRIIPPFHRKWISTREERADMLVKFYLSVFSLAKVICHR